MADEAGHRPKRQRPPAAVGFYIDADLLGLAKVLVQVRPDVPADARNKFAQLEVFMSQWRRIEACCEQPGPFIRITTRTTFRPYGGDGVPV